MQFVNSWPRVQVPPLAGERVPVMLYDAVADSVREVAPPDGIASLYVCGITPYDATHLGHAATYLAFDTLNRALRQSGAEVRFAENITDVDDPLLERAERDRVDWQQLAQSQTDLFRSDMEQLRIIAPDSFVRVQDAIFEIGQAVAQLLGDGFAYSVPTTDAADDDIYLDLQAVQARTPYEIGAISHFSPEELAAAFVEFGGDPNRPGKRCPLDPLLWRAARVNEPSWKAADGIPQGRPGWHVECSVIATGTLPVATQGALITIQGGGRDLLYPHHEMSAAHVSALTGREFAGHFTHAGLVAYQGEKMSKSLGNLVLVSKLVAEGHDPMAVRLAVLAHHYRSSWEWFTADLDAAHSRLTRWRVAAHRAAAADVAAAAQSTPRRQLRTAIANDLDTPAMIEIVDAWAEQAHPQADVIEAVDALLGVQLLPGN
ncbi:cysteine--1-D-myo-inosityl 2-amino-2-deoxy-alpha-D-glucopyranoside ligase [uncultured Gulosibacter sp.]|uniref:cysteine--1-D-myo-inosityl 2-amino-2-deoxy-alpha-D-glucopyranoside ligase n=1 Tax=uncultured Gulosibacter sp. TaxID=1339167 RepID=UPI00288C2915|nr:cysteine--1-D-myo-inosityl 2-amino-2-deoxy-alpha-D-glucopyranoside ligase [uncultured Gulosibacter sp.]